MIRHPYPLGTLLLGAFVFGCTLGPDYQRPETVADDAAFVHAPTAEDENTTQVGPWWRAFDDPTTVALVETALDANTDLAAAAARVVVARSGLRQARSSRLPEVSASLSGSEQKNSFVLPNIGRVSTTSTSFTDNLSVAYQVDLFGGMRRGRQAAWADLLAEIANRETVVHTVVSETVRGRVRVASRHEALRTAQALETSWDATLATIERRYRAGLVSALDVRLARENAFDAEANRIAAERDLTVAGFPLDVLLGRAPGTAAMPTSNLPALPDLPPVPVGLPVTLLERRPDVRAAEWRLAAATARIGVALADLFPGLTLTGSTGNTADNLGDLLASETEVYSLVANLVASIFDGGRRRAAVAAARARADEAAADYAGTVLVAMREVEDALVREAAGRRQLDALTHRRDEARRAGRIARDRYARGVEPLLQVLETERRLRAAERQVIETRAAVWEARIDLHLALGGDWVEDADDPDPSANPRAIANAPAPIPAASPATETTP